jgi:hypothetical protein
MAMVVVMGTWNVTSAIARTVEAGDASNSWIGTGEVHDVENGSQVIHGVVNGVMIIRHFKGDMTKTIHTAPIVCSYLVTGNAQKNHRIQRGLCTVIAHGGKDVAYGQFRCEGDFNECEGEFSFTGGEGGFTGVSGTTVFLNRIIFEKLEAGKARAIGYTSWPNLTYTLP